jgi:ferrous iron transport protein A
MVLIYNRSMSLVSLASLNKNETGIIRAIDESQLPFKTYLKAGELETRLLEMGLIEEARIEVLHFGLWNKDPIAVRINNNTSIVALRRNEASIIMIEKEN